MKPRILSLFSAILLPLASFGSAEAAPARSSPKTPAAPATVKDDGKLQEIQVTLFGQPCTMSGPYPKASLTLLHEISPEKIPPDLGLDPMKRVRTKAGELKSMPMPVEQYRDHLRKRLSAKIAFEEAIEQAKKSKPAEARKALEIFLKNVKEHISTLQYPAFEEGTKKAFDSAAGTWNAAFISSLRERYAGVIQPDTEEEFHKSIRAAKIQYVCAFDDSDPRSGDGEE